MKKQRVEITKFEFCNLQFSFCSAPKAEDS
jgi:hypothetical protein